MELKDYTTEELKEELKRRNKEARALRPRYMKAENHWFMFQAKVIKVKKGYFHAKGYVVDSETLESNPNQCWLNKCHEFQLVANMFSKKEKPQIGDIVEMRARIYRNGRIGYFDAKITRIIKKED